MPNVTGCLPRLDLRHFSLPALVPSTAIVSTQLFQFSALAQVLQRWLGSKIFNFVSYPFRSKIARFWPKTSQNRQRLKNRMEERRFRGQNKESWQSWASLSEGCYPKFDSWRGLTLVLPVSMLKNFHYIAVKKKSDLCHSPKIATFPWTMGVS